MKHLLKFNEALYNCDIYPNEVKIGCFGIHRNGDIFLFEERLPTEEGDIATFKGYKVWNGYETENKVIHITNYYDWSWYTDRWINHLKGHFPFGRETDVYRILKRYTALTRKQKPNYYTQAHGVY